tara:strand:- start:4562 stop:5497 length:936 start_codon:yes stop_codon:yes gene_type:complete
VSGGTSTPGAERLLVRRRFEERFQRDGLGFSARRVVHGPQGVTRSAEMERSWFVERSGEVLRKVKGGLGFWIRLLGRGLLFAPLAWLMELVASWVGVGRGWAIVTLVVLTCVFFGFLNLYVWASLLEWFRQRRMKVERPFDGEGDDRLGLLPAPSGAVVGTIAGLGPAHGEDLWVEGWLEAGPVTRRMCGGDHFAVVPDDGSPPLVCRIDAAPLIVGASETLPLSTLRALFPDTIDEGPVDAVVLRVGDAVALHAEELQEIRRVDHVELDGSIRGYRPERGDDAPYRGGGAQPGQLAVSSATRPLRIRKLR